MWNLKIILPTLVFRSEIDLVDVEVEKSKSEIDRIKSEISKLEATKKGEASSKLDELETKVNLQHDDLIITWNKLIFKFSFRFNFSVDGWFQ